MYVFTYFKIYLGILFWSKVVTINIVHTLENHIGIYNLLHICSR